jgi:UPF0755 protein
LVGCPPTTDLTLRAFVENRRTGTEFAGVMQRERDPLTESDPRTLLFGPDDDHDVGPSPLLTRTERRAQVRSEGRYRRQRSRRVMMLLSVIVVAVVGVSAWLVVPKIGGLFGAPDYAGSGSGSVTVVVGAGDSAADIGATLERDGVVKSAKAFVNAASDDPDSKNVQAGSYRLHSGMSAKSALALLLDPAARLATSDVLVIEGATALDVQARLVQILGAGRRAAIQAAFAAVADLGVPLGYQGTSGAPSSVEGFLYPATYSVGLKDTPASILQQMTGRFVQHDRSTGFAAAANQLKITPYAALIMASIAQSEAKYPADMAKVVRVILNRIRHDRPLQIDATSAYGAKLRGLEPAKVVYATLASPYNSYTHAGLPPTPISNPGADAMSAAVHPPAGDWMYYVNDDAAGHLFFTDNEAAFAKAVEKCRVNHWGCG